MIEKIINNVIDILKITCYEKCILTKIKYNLKLSKEEEFDLFFLTKKLSCYKMITLRGNI